MRGFCTERGGGDGEALNGDAISGLRAAAPSNRLTLHAAKLFDKPDSAKIKNSKLLEDAGRYLERNGYGLAVVASYADLKGDSDKKRQLTAARAALVREYLVQHFQLDDQRIKTFGAGKSADAPEGGAIEIIVYPAGTAAPRPKNGRGDTK